MTPPPLSASATATTPTSLHYERSPDHSWARLLRAVAILCIVTGGLGVARGVQIGVVALITKQPWFAEWRAYGASWLEIASVVTAWALGGLMAAGGIALLSRARMAHRLLLGYAVAQLGMIGVGLGMSVAYWFSLSDLPLTMFAYGVADRLSGVGYEAFPSLILLYLMTRPATRQCLGRAASGG